VPVLAAPPTDPPALPPLADGDPVLWKERHAGRPNPPSPFATPAHWVGALVAVLAVALFVTAGWLLVKRAVQALDPDEATRFDGRGPPDSAGGMLIAAGVLASGLCLLPLAVGVTGCVAGERQRGTLESLLATTLGRRRMLGSKVRAHVERALVFAAGAAAALGAGFGTDGGPRFGLAAVAAFVAGFGLVVGFGAWLSVRCDTPVRAFRLCLPVVVLTVALPVFVWNFTQWDRTGRPVQVLAWVAAVFAVLAGLFYWRAGAGLERGG
jgi:ABC-type transport system involved in cytochrome c biogenesis permease component